MRDSCKRITLQDAGELSGWATVRSFIAFHFTRRYPGWATWLPRHVPRLMPAQSDGLEPIYEGHRKG
jgi:cardiolipin synthase